MESFSIQELLWNLYLFIAVLYILFAFFEGLKFVWNGMEWDYNRLCIEI